MKPSKPVAGSRGGQKFNLVPPRVLWAGGGRSGGRGREELELGAEGQAEARKPD